MWKFNEKKMIKILFEKWYLKVKFYKMVFNFGFWDKDFEKKNFFFF
jgi:hypothetical protein